MEELIKDGEGDLCSPGEKLLPPRSRFVFYIYFFVYIFDQALCENYPKAPKGNIFKVRVTAFHL